MLVVMRGAFREGDVVQLKSGSPKMTVHSVSAAGVSCTWFKGLTLQAAVFNPRTLMRVA
jgi:uncharacterized protein YodC (DUF2158 family)